VAKDLEDSVYVWDSKGVPDGRYRIRVTASDIEGNAVGEERESDALSPVFTVDNTPPSVDSFDATGSAGRIEVRGAASDANGVVARIEVSVDDGDWRAITPAGGLADRSRATFSATLVETTAGTHLVNLRIVDRAGNTTGRSGHVTVGAAR
jgi:hypothetical protein